MSGSRVVGAEGTSTLTAVLVLGGVEAPITDANAGALQVLAGPMGKAQAWVLAALIYVFREEKSRKNHSEGKSIAPLSLGVGLKGLTQAENLNFHLDFKAHTTGKPLLSVCARGSMWPHSVHCSSQTLTE